MPINVAHSGNVAPSAVAAFSGGRGRRLQADTRTIVGIDESVKARIERNNALVSDQQFRSREADKARDFAVDQADAAQRRRQEDFAYEYSEPQKREIEQMANAEAAALASDDFTDAEKEDIKRQFALKRAGLEKTERLRKQTPAEKFAANTHTTKDGTIFPILKDGSFGKPIHTPEAKSATDANKIKQVESAMKYAMTENGTVDKDLFKEGMELFAEQVSLPAEQLGSSLPAEQLGPTVTLPLMNSSYPQRTVKERYWNSAKAEKKHFLLLQIRRIEIS